MFQTILFAYDGSAECRDALREGLAVAGRFSARCHLLAVVPPPPPLALAAGPLPAEILDAEKARVKDIVKEGLARFRQEGIDATGSVVIEVEPARAIGAVARELAADLVIIGHHRRSALDRWWSGSVGHSLLDHLPCSLFVSMPRTTGAWPRAQSPL
jgi:nucleotide-binding universal stress UspA family protein